MAMVWLIFSLLPLTVSGICEWVQSSWSNSSPIVSLSTGKEGQYSAVILDKSQQIFVSSDYSRTWSAKTVNQVLSTSSTIAMSGNGQYVVVVDLNTLLFVSDNFGQNFTDLSSRLPFAAQPKDIAINFDGTAFYLVSAFEVYKSTDAGKSWLFIYKTSTSAQAIATDSTGSQIRVSAYWTLIASSDGGISWVVSTNTVPNELAGFVDITTNGLESYACTSFEKLDGNSQPNQLFKSSDYGVSYSPTTISGYVWDNVGMSSSGAVVIGSIFDSNLQYASYYLSNDHGLSWSETITTLVNPSPYEIPYNALAIDSAGYFVLIGSYDRIYIGKCV